jgi:hypothetical protein
MADLGVGRFIESVESVESVEAASAAITVIESSVIGRDLEALARSIRALALVESGDPVGGMAEAERAIGCCIERGDRYFSAGSHAAFALAAAAAGTKLDRALQVLDDGERVVAETGARGLLPELLYARARVHAARAEHEARRATLRHGLQIAGRNQALGWEKRFRDASASRVRQVP